MSRVGGLVVAAVLIAAAAAAVPAQVLKIERRTHSRLLELQTDVLRQLLDRRPEADAEAAVARAIRMLERGSSPLSSVARAYGVAAGADAASVGADARLAFVGNLVPLALPEVLDPSADGFGTLHVTMHLARKVAPPGDEVTFRVRILASGADGGEVLAEAVIDRATRVDDLLRFRAKTSLDLSELPDGRYVVDVNPIVDGASARAFDPRVRTEFYVHRGFKERAERLPVVVSPTSPRVAERNEAIAAFYAEHEERLLPPRANAAFHAFVWDVQRAYEGQAPVPGADPIEALDHAERVLVNLQAGRLPFAGFRGRLRIGVPAVAVDGPRRLEGAEIARVSVDLTPRPEGQAAPALVVFVPGSPTWSEHVDRPQSPRSTSPAWLAERLTLAGFGAERDWTWAVLESPGRFANAPGAVSRVVDELCALLGADPERVVLVGEREGAYAVTRAFVADRGLARAAAFVLGGVLGKPDLDVLAGRPLLLLAPRSHPVSGRQQDTAELAARVPGALVEAVTDDVPWPIATARSAARLEAFVDRVVR